MRLRQRGREGEEGKREKEREGNGSFASEMTNDIMRAVTTMYTCIRNHNTTHNTQHDHREDKRERAWHGRWRWRRWWRGEGAEEPHYKKTNPPASETKKKAKAPGSANCDTNHSKSNHITENKPNSNQTQTKPNVKDERRPERKKERNQTNKTQKIRRQQLLVNRQNETAAEKATDNDGSCNASNSRRNVWEGDQTTTSTDNSARKDNRSYTRVS